MSYTTRLMPLTSLMMRSVIFCSSGYGISATSTVIASTEVTARIAMRLSYVLPSPMAPTVRTLGNTVKYCQIESAKPACAISSRRMASLSRTQCSRSGVISPKIRTASPGPGNGCRLTSSSGIPSAVPSARTSSLNSIRSGSISSLKSICSGSPPTL